MRTRASPWSSSARRAWAATSPRTCRSTSSTATRRRSPARSATSSRCRCRTSPAWARATSARRATPIFRRRIFTHGPITVGGCLPCHDYQSFPNKYELRSQGAELCYSCHDRVREQIGKSTFIHGPVAAGILRRLPRSPRRERALSAGQEGGPAVRELPPGHAHGTREALPAQADRAGQLHRVPRPARLEREQVPGSVPRDAVRQVPRLQRHAPPAQDRDHGEDGVSPGDPVERGRHDDLLHLSLLSRVKPAEALARAEGAVRLGCHEVLERQGGESGDEGETEGNAE